MDIRIISTTAFGKGHDKCHSTSYFRDVEHKISIERKGSNGQEIVKEGKTNGFLS